MRHDQQCEQLEGGVCQCSTRKQEPKDALVLATKLSSAIEIVRDTNSLQLGKRVYDLLTRIAESVEEVIVSIRAERKTRAEIRYEALTEIADSWQWGEWANAPRRADKVEERLATAQHVTDWLRHRANQEKPE